VGEGAAPGTPQLIDEIFGKELRAFSPDAHLACPGTVSIWGRSQPVAADHLLNPLGQGWNLTRNRFDDDLREAAKRLGVHVRQGAKVSKVERTTNGWKVWAETAETGIEIWRTPVLVDASGRVAGIARRQGVRQHHADRLMALCAVWAVTDRDRDCSTYVQAVEQGWWYSVLLSGQRRMVAFLTDADLMPASPAQRRALAGSARHTELIGPLLQSGEARQIVQGPRLETARSSRLDRFAGSDWLAAGDAACTFDPLSGRGITVALLTGRSAGLDASTRLSGGPTDGHGHSEGIHQLLARTRAEQHDVYRAERRWPANPFWRRRHQLLERPVG
jgi:flavin-dependent dehydrogenase